MGGDACADDECLKIWRPFRASADAKSNGFWEVITRHDGIKQWAYKGYALYTYAGDKAPGQNRGKPRTPLQNWRGAPTTSNEP